MSHKSCYRIAVYPGDGIGQEVTPLAFDVLHQAIGDTVELDCTEFPWGVTTGWSTARRRRRTTSSSYAPSTPSFWER